MNFLGVNKSREGSRSPSKENVQSVTDLIKESFKQAHSNLDLKEVKDLKKSDLRRTSVISDTLKLQGLDHKIDGHEKGNFKNKIFI